MPNSPPASDPPPGDDAYVGVRYVIDHFLTPGRPRGLTDSLEWSCRTCRTGGDAPDVHRAISAVTDHAYRHHHRGPGVLS